MFLTLQKKLRLLSKFYTGNFTFTLETFSLEQEWEEGEKRKSPTHFFDSLMLVMCPQLSFSSTQWHCELPSQLKLSKTKKEALTCCAVLDCFRQRGNSKNSLWRIMWRWGSLSLVMLTHPSSKPAQAVPNMCQRRTWWCGPSSLSL